MNSLKRLGLIKPNIQLDLFPSGHLVTCGIGQASERVIVYANLYFTEILGIEPGEPLGKQLSDFFTKASSIMIETYLVPMLLRDESVHEMQLDLLLSSGVKQPVVVNAIRSDSDRELVYWSLFCAGQRDKLYQELILARREVEEKARRFEELAATDSLTGLLNRREVIRRTEFLLSYQRRLSLPISIIVLDIDHFKKINDRYGHQKGDEIIKAVAQAFKSVGRESDIIGRFGGEEFVILMPGADEESIISAVERIQDKLKKIDLIETPVTVSMGIAIAKTADPLSFRDLFACADRALYAAKHAGRNRYQLSTMDKDE